MDLITESNTYLCLKDGRKISNFQMFVCAKCISNDSEIITPDGRKILSKIPFNEKFLIWSYNKQKKFEKDMAIRINSGKKEVFEVETESGYKIKVTKDHRFLCKDNGLTFKKMAQLNVGDKIFGVF